jgi:hypothetical protein
MNKKKNYWVSLLLFIIAAFCVSFYLSYTFYKISKNSDPITKVASTNYYDIDSLKAMAVSDTILHFKKEIAKIKYDLTDKDSIIVELRSKNERLQRNFDSIDYKFDSYRQRLKNKNDSIK